MNSKKQLPRGIRNNNPLNIRIGNNWYGERVHQTDKEFEQFISMKMGCRAAFIILKNYIKKYKLATIQKIISRWAPANENHTKVYIDYVARYCNIDKDRTITYEAKDEMCEIFQAMVIFENGMTIDPQIIRDAYEMVKYNGTQ